VLCSALWGLTVYFSEPLAMHGSARRQSYTNMFLPIKTPLAKTSTAGQYETTDVIAALVVSKLDYSGTVLVRLPRSSEASFLRVLNAASAD
jgi:hypothetical protein